MSVSKDEVFFVPDLGTDCGPRIASVPTEIIVLGGFRWLEHVKGLLTKPILESQDWISWAAYEASCSQPPTSPPATSYMLPLFTESSTSPAMLLHGMKLVCQAINHINPGQTPVMEADQPLFTGAKKVLWKFKDSDINERTFLVTLGAMHTEKMLWGASGNWLDDSGWTTALVNSGVTTSGRAQGFIGVHHICRTRYIHQVSVSAIYILLLKAHEIYVETWHAVNGEETVEGGESVNEDDGRHQEEDDEAIIEEENMNEEYSEEEHRKKRAWRRRKQGV